MFLVFVSWKLKILLSKATLTGAWHLWAGPSICPPGSANAGTPITSLPPLFIYFVSDPLFFLLSMQVSWWSGVVGGLNLVLPEMVIYLGALKLERNCWPTPASILFSWRVRFLKTMKLYWLFRQLKLWFWWEIPTDVLLSSVISFHFLFF